MLASFMTAEYSLYGGGCSSLPQKPTPKNFRLCPEGQYLSSFVLIKLVFLPRGHLLHQSTPTLNLLCTLLWSMSDTIFPHKVSSPGSLNDTGCCVCGLLRNRILSGTFLIPSLYISMPIILDSDNGQPFLMIQFSLYIASIKALNLDSCVLSFLQLIPAKLKVTTNTLLYVHSSQLLHSHCLSRKAPSPS